MQRIYNPTYCILVSVIALGLTSLVIGVDAQAQIAFVSGKNKKADIYVMDADGGNTQKLTKNGRSWRPSWSPDGERIAFVSDRGDFEIYVMKADGRKPRNLTNNRHDDGAPSWSPDGKHIVFESERDDNEDIYVMDTDGKNQRNITKDHHDDAVPAWSPDGKRIAFVSYRGNDSKGVDIYVMNVNGENRRNLTKSFDRTAWKPSWSPDGKRIAFVSAVQGDEPEIYVMNINDGIPQKITDNHWLDNDPSWSPDGKRIAFASKRGQEDGDWDIYVMDADGGNLQNLTNNPLAKDIQPAWYRPAFAVAPVGKQFTMWGWLKQIVR